MLYNTPSKILKDLADQEVVSLPQQQAVVHPVDLVQTPKDQVDL